MTPEQLTPDATAPADPPTGAIQRVAAEMLDVLAEQLGEEYAETTLPELLARYAEAAADAHQIPWNAWIRDGIETAALLGLAITALPLPLGLLKRDKLAVRFADLPTVRQRTWLTEAADVLHRLNAADAYGPPIGESRALHAPQPQHMAATPPPAAESVPPTHVGHAHTQGVYLQFLPACLAPSDSDRAGQPGLGLPREGDPVVITRGHVMFLTTDDRAERSTAQATHLWGAPIIGEGCGAARWDADSVTVLDPSYTGLEDGEAEEIQTAWTLLLDRVDEFPLVDQVPTAGGPR